MDVIELLTSLQSAYQDVKAKAQVRDETGQKYHDAVTAHEDAVEALRRIQASLNEMLGVEATNSRVRQG